MPILDPSSDTALEIVRDVIEASWEQANIKSAAYSSKVATMTGVGGVLDLNGTPEVTAGSVAVPTITAPNITIADAAVNDVFDTFTTEYLEIATWLTGQFTTFIATYCPNNTALYTAAEDSLRSALASGTYLPPALADQIVTDERDRITADAARAQADVLESFATKRLPLPSGAASAAALKIQRKAQEEVAGAIRKVAIMSVEQYRYVIDKSLDARKLMLDAAIDYVKALASGPDMISRMVNIGYDAQSKMVSAASEFYRADANAKETVSKVAQYNASLALDAGKFNASSTLEMLDKNLKALIADAQSIAQEAVSLFNNLHAQASVSGQRGTHVQYQYQNDTQTAPPSTTDVF